MRVDVTPKATALHLRIVRRRVETVTRRVRKIGVPMERLRAGEMHRSLSVATLAMPAKDRAKGVGLITRAAQRSLCVEKGCSPQTAGRSSSLMEAFSIRQGGLWTILHLRCPTRP